MVKLIILGTSNAIPTEGHENTHMALVGEERLVLIDCVSNPLLRLGKAGLDVARVTDIILTHFHPDHVSGVPLMLMDMWLLGRRNPLAIYGLHHTLDRIEALMGYYEWSKWPHFFPVAFHHIPEEEMIPVLDCEDFRVLTSPVRHVIPTIGLRVEFAGSGRVLAYSCDTEPCQEVVRLARGADVLIHEATGRGLGHSSASQAAEVARQAAVKELYLIHYPTREADPLRLVAEAEQSFSSRVALAEDFMVLEL